MDAVCALYRIGVLVVVIRPCDVMLLIALTLHSSLVTFYLLQASADIKRYSSADEDNFSQVNYCMSETSFYSTVGNVYCISVHVQFVWVEFWTKYFYCI